MTVYYYIDPNGGYYQTDTPTDDTEVTQRPSYDYSWVNGAWSINASNFSETLKTELAALQEQKFCANCPCTVGQDSFSVQVRNPEDKTILLAKMAAAKDYIDQSLPNTSMSIRCAGNNSHTMTATEMVAMLRGILAWADDLGTKYHAHKDTINALVATINDPQSTQQQINDATAALTNYDVTLNW